MTQSRMTRRRSVVIASAVLTLCACHEQAPPAATAEAPGSAPCLAFEGEAEYLGDICTLEPHPSLEVTAYDADTGERICDLDVVAIGADGERLVFGHFGRESKKHCSFVAEGGSETTFTVSAHKRGYEAQSRRVVMRAIVPGCSYHAPAVRFELHRKSGGTAMKTRAIP